MPKLQLPAPPMKLSPLHWGLLLAALGTALFALKSIFIKFAYAEGVDTTTLLALRMLISMPFYAFMALWLLRTTYTKQGTKRIRPNRMQLVQIGALGFFGYYLASWLDMHGLNFITAQLERLTLYTYPIMTTLLSALILKERITRWVVTSLLLTYSGVLLLYWNELSLSGDAVHFGVLLVIASALSFSFYVVFSKGLIDKLGSRLFVSLAMLASSVYVLLHFFVTHDFSDLLVNHSAWVYAVLLAVFSTILPSYMVSEAIARVGASKTSIVGTAGPVVTIFIAVWLLDEPFGTSHLLGVVLVMLGVALLGKR